MRKLSLAGFRRYLQRSPKARFTAKSCNRCPLAQYTGRQVGGYFILSKDTPAWAKEFIKAFDGDGRKTMSGKSTLAVLMASAYRKG